MNTKRKYTLSASFIVKDEEKHLPRLLEQVKKFTDEIIILDTGSTDSTIEISKSYGAIVYEYIWEKNFAKARNLSLSYCKSDFIIWLDADDVILEEDISKFNRIMENTINWDVLYLPYYYNSKPNNLTHGKRKKPPRVFRNNIGITWISPIHEHLLYTNKVIKKRDIEDISIYHQPLRESTSNALRNLDIMCIEAFKQENLGTDYHFWHIGKEYSGLQNRRKAIDNLKKALSLNNHSNLFSRARIQYLLAKQYYFSGYFKKAIEYCGLVIANYSNWREPFILIVESYIKLNLHHFAFTYLEIAKKIDKHSYQIERNEIYDNHFIEELDKLIEKYDNNIIYNVELKNTKRKIFVAAGDVCLARQVPDYIMSNGYSHPFKKAKNILDKADAAMINLECVVSNTGKPINKGGRRPYYYRANPLVLNTLVSSGINIVTTANNHSMDYGVEALNEQSELLDACNIAHAGSGFTTEECIKPTYVLLDDIIVAIISIDTETSFFKVKDYVGGINTASNYTKILHNIAAGISIAKNYANITIVSPHWGANWQEKPSLRIQKLAHDIIDCGADIILGHSAHVLQGIEIYKDKAIIYDMGSLLFDRVSQDRMNLSSLFELKIIKEGVESIIIHPISLRRARVTTSTKDEQQEILEIIKKLSLDLNGKDIFKVEDGYLVIKLNLLTKNINIPISVIEPEDIYSKNQLKYLSKHYSERSNFCQTFGSEYKFKSLKKKYFLEDKIEINSVFIPKQVKPNYSFIVRAILNIIKPLDYGHFDGYIILKNEKGEIVLTYLHPLTEGVYPHRLWKQGEILLHETVVRPPKNLKEGKYTIYFYIYDRINKRYLHLIDSDNIIPMIEFGEIEILNSAPKYIAGL